MSSQADIVGADSTHREMGWAADRPSGEAPWAGTTGGAGSPAWLIQKHSKRRSENSQGTQQEWEHFSRIIPAGTHELASSLAGAVPENQQQAPPNPIPRFPRSLALH